MPRIVSYRPDRSRLAGTLRSCVGGVLLLFGLVATARAQTAIPRSSALNWVRRPGAESCPAAIEVARQIDERLGRRVFSSPSTAELSVEAWVQREDSPARKWQASITVYAPNGTATGQRQLESAEPSCAKLAEASVLAIALMIDPEAAEAAEAQAPSAKNEKAEKSPDPSPSLSGAISAAESATPAQSTRELGVPGLVKHSARPQFRAQLSAAAVFLTALLPGSALGIAASVRARSPAASLGVELSGAYYFENAREFGAGKGGRFNASYIGVAPCWTLAEPALIEPWLCAGAQFGVLNATGYGFQESVAVQRSWLLNGALEAHALVHVSARWAAALSAGLLVPLHRETFEVTVGAQSKELFRPAALAELLALGVVYDW